MVQGGDFISSDGKGSRCIYGTTFPDENFILRHRKAGVLSMANSGPNTNSCQFFITCSKCDWLDGKHVVFGQILGEESMLLLRKLEAVSTISSSQKPNLECKIIDCGEL